MIKYLKGEVKEITKDSIIVEIKNIGYEIIYLNASCNNDEEIKLYIHEEIKENEYTLYGFDNLDELNLFKKFQKIKGIGANRSYYIVRMYNNDDIKIAIDDKNIDFFTSIPKIGKKMAKKIVEQIKVDFSINRETEELKIVLKNMGYGENEIYEYIKKNKVSEKANENISNFILWLNKKNDA